MGLRGHPGESLGICSLRVHRKSEFALVNQFVNPLESHQGRGKAVQAHDTPHMVCWSLPNGSQHLASRHFEEGFERILGRLSLHECILTRIPARHTSQNAECIVDLRYTVHPLLLVSSCTKAPGRPCEKQREVSRVMLYTNCVND